MWFKKLVEWSMGEVVHLNIYYARRLRIGRLIEKGAVLDFSDMGNNLRR